MDRAISVVSVKEKLTCPHDRDKQLPVVYAYDHLRNHMSFLRRPALQLNSYLEAQTFLRMARQKDTAAESRLGRSEHAIDLYPLGAGLPWASGILHCRQNKHWQLSLDTAEAYLKEFASDGDAEASEGTGKSMAEIAQKELASNFHQGWARFPIYASPDGDEQRTRLIAAMNVFIFLFDDFWEMNDTSHFQNYRRILASKLEGGPGDLPEPASVMESLVDKTFSEVLQLAAQDGNDSGKVYIEETVRFFSHPPPPDSYKNLEEFMAYRCQDAAIMYFLAATKFGLNSSVDIYSPRLARFIHLLKYHGCIVNDLFSWEKEKTAYDSGEVKYLINTVEVVKNLFSLSSYDAAISMTQALQFQVERDIDEELQRLVEANALTAVEWQFLDAALFAMSGNYFSSLSMNRYGGESCALKTELELSAGEDRVL